MARESIGIDPMGSGRKSVEDEEDIVNSILPVLKATSPLIVFVVNAVADLFAVVEKAVPSVVLFVF